MEDGDQPVVDREIDGGDWLEEKDDFRSDRAPYRNRSFNRSPERIYYRSPTRYGSSRRLSSPIRHYEEHPYPFPNHRGGERRSFIHNEKRFLMSFYTFRAQRENRDLSNEELSEKYSEYSKQFKRTELISFFKAKKNTEWFKERYSTSSIVKKRQARTKICKERANLFDEMVSKNEIPNLYLNIPNKEELEKGSSSGEDNNEKSFYKNRVYITLIPPSTTHEELHEMFSTTPGFQEVVIDSSNIHPRYYNRTGYAIYSSPSECQSAITKLDQYPLQFDGDRKCFLHLVPHRHPTPKGKVTIAPVVSLSEERLVIDLRQAIQLCKQLDGEKMILKNSLVDSYLDSLTLPSNEDTIDTSKNLNLLKLNACLSYLRFVHFYCYYCVKEFDNEENLIIACGHYHPRATSSSVNDGSDNLKNERWANTLDNKITNRLLKANIDILTEEKNTIISNPYSANAISNFFKDATIEENDGVRCKICGKLFQNNNFCSNHIEKRHNNDHEEAITKGRNEQYLKNYLNDIDPVLPPSLLPFENEAPSRPYSYQYNPRQNMTYRGRGRGTYKRNTRYNPSSNIRRRTNPVYNDSIINLPNSNDETNHIPHAGDHYGVDTRSIRSYRDALL